MTMAKQDQLHNRGLSVLLYLFRDDYARVKTKMTVNNVLNSCTFTLSSRSHLVVAQPSRAGPAVWFRTTDYRVGATRATAQRQQIHSSLSASQWRPDPSHIPVCQPHHSRAGLSSVQSQPVSARVCRTGVRGLITQRRVYRPPVPPSEHQ